MGCSLTGGDEALESILGATIGIDDEVVIRGFFNRFASASEPSSRNRFFERIGVDVGEATTYFGMIKYLRIGAGTEVHSDCEKVAEGLDSGIGTEPSVGCTSEEIEIEPRRRSEEVAGCVATVLAFRTRSLY